MNYESTIGSKETIKRIEPRYRCADISKEFKSAYGKARGITKLPPKRLYGFDGRRYYLLGGDV